MPPKVRITTKRQMPVVWIDHPVYRDMLDIANATHSEVAWFGEVEAYEDEVYLVTNVSVPEQQANGSTVEMEPSDLERFALGYLEEHGTEAYNRLRLWGHSHNTMGVSPSSQDDGMVDALCEMIGEPFIAVRINHKGDIQADVAYPDGITIANCELHVGLYDPERTKQWKEIVKQRLRKITYAHKAPQYDKHGYAGGWQGWQQSQQHGRQQGTTQGSTQGKAATQGKASGGALVGPVERTDAEGREWIWDHKQKSWLPYDQASKAAQAVYDMAMVAETNAAIYQTTPDPHRFADEPTDLDDWDWETEMEVLNCEHKYDTQDEITFCINCRHLKDDIEEIEHEWGADEQGMKADLQSYAAEKLRIMAAVTEQADEEEEEVTS